MQKRIPPGRKYHGTPITTSKGQKDSGDYACPTLEVLLLKLLRHWLLKPNVNDVTINVSINFNIDLVLIKLVPAQTENVHPVLPMGRGSWSD